MQTRQLLGPIVLLFGAGAASAVIASGCGTSSSAATDAGAASDATSSDDCHAPPQTRTTPAGVSFVRTPDACFARLTDFPYAPKYVELDGLQQAYIDEGPANADPILLLHGEPSWSYLYRKMIPVLVSAGHRVIAMDHLGMGRSDKPTDIHTYSYLGHADRLLRFIQTLHLSNITLFCQDWGSLIGLHVAGEHTDLFARIVVGDGTLPVFPAGTMPVPPIADPDTPDPTAPDPFLGVPAQQRPFYDANGNPLPSAMGTANFTEWAIYAMKNPSFHAAEVVEAMTWYPLPADAYAAYDSPFPSREYMAGARVFPSLLDGVGGTNDAAWAGLQSYTKPFLTIWSSNDPGNLGRYATQQSFIDHVPGAKGQPHMRLANASHFLQDDQGAQIATIMNEWIAGDAPPGNFGGADAGVGDAAPPVEAGALGCASPASCSGATPVCCATIPITGGSPPNCSTGMPTSACTSSSACPTSLGGGSCSGQRVVRFCTTNADCTEASYDLCCTFNKSGNNVKFCANSMIASVAGGTCM